MQQSEWTYLSLSFLSHLSAPVRASTAQKLRPLADKLGPAAVLTFTQRFLTASSEMLPLKSGVQLVFKVQNCTILKRLSLQAPWTRHPPGTGASQGLDGAVEEDRRRKRLM